MTKIPSIVIKKANDKVIQACRMGQVLAPTLPNEKTEREIREAFQIASSVVARRKDFA